MKIYAIYDLKAETYDSVMCFPSDIYAMRYLSSLVHNSDSIINSYPSDFGIRAIGEFDNKLGIIKPYEIPLFIENADALI